MSDDREFLRATSEWLEAGSDRTPAEAVDAVLLAIRTTRQDRVLPNPWRHIDMHALGKALVAATAVVAIALAWTSFGPSTNNVGVAPSPTPTPTPTPSVLTSRESAALEPGRYAFPSLHTGVPAELGTTYPRLSITVPSGWSGRSNLVGKDATGDLGPAAPFLFVWAFDRGYIDPCTDHTPVQPAAGSGAAGLLDVIAGQPGVDAGPITDVTVGGHDGKYVDFTVTIDPATCGDVGDPFWIWGSPDGDRRYGVDQNRPERAYAIDVDGTIYTFFTNEPRGDLLAADRAELQRLIDSIEFEPAG
jgi:hypothetical protein